MPSFSRKFLGLGTESRPEARDWAGTEKTQSRAGAQNTLKTPLLGRFQPFFTLFLGYFYLRGEAEGSEKNSLVDNVCKVTPLEWLRSRSRH